MTDLQEGQPFIEGGPFDDDERRKRPAWCDKCDNLVRFLEPFLSDQKPAWRTHILSKEEHRGHVLETIPLGEWSHLDSLGMVGRRERLTYTAIRQMSPETFLRIVAKFPRRRSVGEATVAEVVRKITADPILKESLVQRRFRK